MIEKSLMTQDHVGKLREKQDLLHKLKTHDVHKYLRDLEYKPSLVDSFDEDERPWTIIGCCRQWLQSRLPSMNTAKDPKALLDQFASLQDQNWKQQQTIADLFLTSSQLNLESLVFVFRQFSLKLFLKEVEQAASCDYQNMFT